MLVLFSLSIFLSAVLLFMVEPMFGKMALPLLGGSPAVWNTCMVFYQGALLAGYLYAHLAPRLLGVQRQAAFHLGLLLLILLTLPIGIFHGWTPPASANPTVWLLLLLMLSVGLPFFMVSSTAPLLQKWFAHTNHASAHDPYFLYGASNLGSVLALVAYPLLIEPYLRLGHQSWAWAVGYVLLVILITLCGVMLWRASAQTPVKTPVTMEPDVSSSILLNNKTATPASSPLTFSQRTWWVLLAFAPSSLLLGVTTYLSTDIASVPLLWIIPLLIYLISFVLVFARRPLIPRRVMVFWEPLFIVPVATIFFIRMHTTVWQTIPLQLLAFFCIAMVCHGELMHSRPLADHLTEFYLWISVGGVLGGIFNALLAPVLFNSVIEYPLIIAVACLLRPNLNPTEEKSRPYLYDLLLPLGLGVLLVLLGKACQMVPDNLRLLVVGLIACLAGCVCYSFRFRPLRLALGVGVLIIAGMWFTQPERILLLERNFFGVAKVTEDSTKRYHILLHGSTLHGAQSLDPARRREPLTYYHRSGPLGQVFAEGADSASRKKVAVIGLGTGTIACYGQPGQEFTFYEIDPAMERIARDQRFFTYLSDTRADVKVVLGDARLSLNDAPEAGYDMIILDAFSSDAIPIHLVTREAANLYLNKLKPGGTLVFHISNRYLNLKPVLGNLAREAGLVALVRADLKLSDEDNRNKKSPSTWVVLSRHWDDLGNLPQDQRWQALPAKVGESLWTDDFSNILTVFNWKLRVDDWIYSFTHPQ